VTQRNASASRELAGTAQELAGQAEVLRSTIAFFKVEDGRQTGSESLAIGHQFKLAVAEAHHS
jgi:methyl-accepting chemotaxis protein